jgi:hypothetical protein
MSKEYDKGHKTGASKSIEITMDEIGAILEGGTLKEAGPLRADLRELIESSLTSLSMKWYKKGFNRGHKESYKEFVVSDEFPLKISATVSRSLIPKSKKQVALRSSLKNKFIEKIEA